jgi:hypothetical protein
MCRCCKLIVETSGPASRGNASAGDRPLCLGASGDRSQSRSPDAAIPACAKKESYPLRYVGADLGMQRL